MGMPVKLSDELVMAARDEAQAADRSITGQIEHWAKLGKAVERVLGGSVIRLLKDFPTHDPAPVSTEALRSRVLAALNQLTVDPDREAALRLIAAESRAAYEADPDRPGRVVQVSPDGSRTPGRFRGRTFVPAKTSPAK